MGRLVVGVSGINAVDNPGPGVGVARSLKEDSGLDVEVVGLAYDAMEPGIYMDWVIDRSYIMPYPSASGQALVDRLLYIRDSHGLDFVIPSLDAELPGYIACAGELARHGIASVLPGSEQFRLRGKDRLGELADGLGLSVPRTRVVTSLDQLRQAVVDIGLPVMVKGAFYQAHRADTLQQAASHYHGLVAEWGYPVIVQQVVAGEELNVVGLGDGEGESLGLVAVKKVFLSSLGKIWTGVTVRNRALLEAASDLVRLLRWRGPFELECMVAGDQVYLIEVNPRFPAWLYFATGVGVNLPARLVRHGLGLPIEPSSDEYAAGKLFVRYSFELVTDMEPFRKVVTRGEYP